MTTTAPRRPPSIAEAEAPPGCPTMEALYRAHAGAVLGFAHRLLRDRSLAEEVTQDVFVRLWRRPERFDPVRGSMRAFLLADCHGRAVDVIRSESARRQREERDGRSAERTGGADVAVDVCDSVIHDQVSRLVHALPDGEREAISLAYRNQITYREVATALDVPEGTVKGRIRSGLRRLRVDAAALGIDAA